MNSLLAGAIAAVEEEGQALQAEFHRPDGPRGQRGSAPIDGEIEARLVAKLQALLPCAFAGEETGRTAACSAGHDEWLWLVDPHDGTSEFLRGRRGSAISVALLRNRVAVLGVVCSPLSPDRGWDTIAWAEGEALLRNGVPIRPEFAQGPQLVWATASSAARPGTFSRAALPARYVAMPSIAYRLARVAAGDGLATLSTHPVNEYDFAAGMALLRARGGALVDAEGKDIELTGEATRRVSGLFAGERGAVARLCAFGWGALEAEPKRSVRVPLGFPRRRDEPGLERAAGCLLGLVIGESLRAPREHHTLPGQPADAGEMALVLARGILADKRYDKDNALARYRDWLQSRPVDVAATIERGLLGLHTSESESNGSLARVAPIGVWAAGDPARAAAAAREDCRLTHPHPLCLEACAAFAAAIAAGAGGGTRQAMLEAARAQAKGAVRAALDAGRPPERFDAPRGGVLIALQNAFHRLARQDFAQALDETFACGGDVDSNAAIAGALLGAALGRSAIPSALVLPVLACRPLDEAGALRPRPMDYWPDDILEVAEALLALAP